MGGFSSGVYSRFYNWTNDANAGIDILPGRMDTEDTGFATGLSTCILKDGTQTVTANIPFAGFRLTGVGAATALTDAAQYSQTQNSASTWLGSLSGTNSYTANTTPTFTTYAAGQKFSGIFTNANTATSTLAINSIASPVTIKKLTTAGLANLVSGDIPAGVTVQLTYDGTFFVVDGIGLGTIATQATASFLQVANNLSDVNNAATARTNLGVSPPNYFIGGTTTGSANIQVLASPSPSGFTYATGNLVHFVSGFLNTGDTTINIAALGAMHIFKSNPNGTAVVTLTGGELQLNNPYLLSVESGGAYAFLIDPSQPLPQSLATSGYQTLPGGVIIQWGSSSTAINAGASINTTYPLAFPNNAFSVVVQPVTFSGANAACVMPNVTLTSKTAFATMNNDGDTNIATWMWQAIGN